MISARGLAILFSLFSSSFDNVQNKNFIKDKQVVKLKKTPKSTCNVIPLTKSLRNLVKQIIDDNGYLWRENIKGT